MTKVPKSKLLMSKNRNSQLKGQRVIDYRKRLKEPTLHNILLGLAKDQRGSSFRTQNFVHVFYSSTEKCSWVTTLKGNGHLSQEQWLLLPGMWWLFPGKWSLLQGKQNCYLMPGQELQLWSLRIAASNGLPKPTAQMPIFKMGMLWEEDHFWKKLNS